MTISREFNALKRNDLMVLVSYVEASHDQLIPKEIRTWMGKEEYAYLSTLSQEEKKFLVYTYYLSPLGYVTIYESISNVEIKAIANLQEIIMLNSSAD